MVLKIAKIDLFDRDALISAIPLMAPIVRWAPQSTTSPQPERHLDHLAVFAKLTVVTNRQTQTDMQTDHATLSHL